MCGKILKRDKQPHQIQLLEETIHFVRREIIEAVKKRNLRRSMRKMAEEMDISDRSLRTIVKGGLALYHKYSTMRTVLSAFE